MAHLRFLSLIFLFSSAIYAQKGTIKGKVVDNDTNEPLIGVNVIYAPGKGAATDFDGMFMFEVPNGKYTLNISYVGYQVEQKDITVNNNIIDLKIKMKPMLISEVTVVADVARSRETPVAFSTIPPKKLEEELGSRDIPMVLNSTPGVYATQQGGGDGDARINIRGFSQRNIAVMLDGLPVNDMENGWVYWSNWFGLDAVTRNIQVQRGLGASKLALPSVGGTMNILTAGIQNKRKLTIKQSVQIDPDPDYFGFIKNRTTIGFNSGKLKNGWGFTLAASYKKGDGYVDETWTEGYFAYLKIDKRLKNHIISVTAMGAPQSHAQRSYKMPIATYDSAYAVNQGVDVFPWNADKGIRYNQNWGYLKRDRFDENASEEKLSANVNEYFKPMFSLRDFWTVNKKLSISNIAYLSIGKGGGSGASGSIAYNDEGQMDWQSYYDQNTKPVNTGFGIEEPYINPTYSETEHMSSAYLYMNKNEHVWYGLLSTLNYEYNQKLSFSGGIDARSYTGIHYREVYDLLGGDYILGGKKDVRLDYASDPTLDMKGKGDKYYFYNEGLVRWGGLFAQAEYKFGNFSSFLNVTSALSGYKKIDYFNDTSSTWATLPGFTIKGGTNYNISEDANVFFNAGYLNKARDYNSYFQGYTVHFVEELESEGVFAIEGGYSYSIKNFAINLNSYFTQWKNKAMTLRGIHIDATHDQENGQTEAYTGMDARHMGVEADFAFKITPKLKLEGLVSLGDWIWDKKITDLQMYYRKDRTPANKITFNAKGIHVGDAAQTQLGGSLRYEPVKGMYIMAKSTFFDRYYADFNPEDCEDENGDPEQSWRAPMYNLVDFHAGYKFKLKSIDKMAFKIKLSVFNALDNRYISDARNNDSYSSLAFNDFDAKSATVFFGMGRRINFGLTITIL